MKKKVTRARKRQRLGAYRLVMIYTASFNTKVLSSTAKAPPTIIIKAMKIAWSPSPEASTEDTRSVHEREKYPEACES
jgi:hypothetical protein